MKTLAILALLASASAHAGTAFFSHEEGGGFSTHKQCVYDYLGSRYVITVPVYQV